MSRHPKDPSLRIAMCRRLSAALNESQLTDKRLSELMGYSTSATLCAMRRGEVFLDAEKLAKLGGLRLREVAHINLHWVLTGEGDAFLPATTNSADLRYVTAMNDLVLSPVSTTT